MKRKPAPQNGRVRLKQKNCNSSEASSIILAALAKPWQGSIAALGTILLMAGATNFFQHCNAELTGKYGSKNRHQFQPKVESRVSIDPAGIIKNAIVELVTQRGESRQKPESETCQEPVTKAQSFIPPQVDIAARWAGYDPFAHYSDVPNKVLKVTLTKPNDIAIAYDCMIMRESNGQQFDKYGKPLKSPKGAVGIAQLLPKTAKDVATKAGIAFSSKKLLHDVHYNRTLGIKYFKELLASHDGDLAKSCAAYNMGPTALANALEKASKNGNKKDWVSSLPKETRQYLTKVVNTYVEMSGTRHSLALIAANSPNPNG